MHAFGAFRDQDLRSGCNVFEASTFYFHLQRGHSRRRRLCRQRTVFRTLGVQPSKFSVRWSLPLDLQLLLVQPLINT